MEKDNGHNDDRHNHVKDVLPIRQMEYIMLVDHTGRAISRNKRGRDKGAGVE